MPNFDPIDELKIYLTLQLEAHLQQDWEAYDELEKKIMTIEHKL